MSEFSAQVNWTQGPSGGCQESWVRAKMFFRVAFEKQHIKTKLHMQGCAIALKLDGERTEWVWVFDRSLLNSPRLHLFDQKYIKNFNIVKWIVQPWNSACTLIGSFNSMFPANRVHILITVCLYSLDTFSECTSARSACSRISPPPPQHHLSRSATEGIFLSLQQQQHVSFHFMCCAFCWSLLAPQQ